MKKIEREDIHILSRHSNLTEADIDKALTENVYNNKEAWQTFLRFFFLSLGVGFTVCGIVFFFAYNWADLHKFTKLGLVEGLIVVTTVLALLPTINITIRNIILTGAAMIVGALFAVFGQIYQTGANAYDFFLGWTVFISLWVVVSNFAPLWLLYIALINTTIILYAEQVTHNWTYIEVQTILFLLNTAILIVSLLLSHYNKIKLPTWFSRIIAISSASYATLGIIEVINRPYQIAFPLLILSTAILFTGGMWYGLQTKNTFYLSLIPLSLIVIGSALLMERVSGYIEYLLVSLFVIGSATAVVTKLMNLQKGWEHEE